MCIRTKTREKLRPHQQIRSTSVNDSTSLDAIGKLEGKKHHTLNLVMLSIGHVMGKAVKKLNSRVVADYLMSYCCECGVPKRIITDWGPEFIGKVFQHLRNRLRHEHMRITIKNKRGNSKVERCHRAIDNGMVAQCSQHLDAPKNFPDYLEGICVSINTMQRKNRPSPAMLLRGCQPKFAPDLESKKIKTRNVEDAEQLDDRIERMEKMRLLFSECDQEKKLFRNIKHNEKLGQLSDHAIGDSVWCHRDENRKGDKVSGECDVRKTGPCTVVSRNPKTEVCGTVDPDSGFSAEVHARHPSSHGTHRDLPGTVEVDPDEVDTESSDGSSADDAPDEDEAAEEAAEELAEEKKSRRNRARRRMWPHLPH